MRWIKKAELSKDFFGDMRDSIDLCEGYIESNKYSKALDEANTLKDLVEELILELETLK